MAKQTFYIETYGCKINQYESESIRESWLEGGYAEVMDPAEADFIIINSCAITSRAERDSRNAIYRNKKKSPAASIILTGCAAGLFKNFTPRKNGDFSQPDYIIDQQDKGLLLSGIGTGEKRRFSIKSCARARPVIKIQDGCSRYCSYCIVPLTRGKPSSRSPKEILEECERLLGQGYGELVLSGINLAQYAPRLDGINDFWDLLAWLDRRLAENFGIKARLRISSIDPGQLTDRALEILAQCQIVCPHLHLSLQHMSPGILKKMRRGFYSFESTLSGIEKLRQHWPLLGLGADIIAGFPGETERDLDFLLQAIKALGLTYGHVFPFSARPGTLAASLDGQIAKREKDCRAKLIRDCLKELKSKFARELLALSHLTVVADQNDSGHAICEYYVDCQMEESSHSGRELISVTPLGLGQTGLIVKK